MRMVERLAAKDYGFWLGTDTPISQTQAAAETQWWMLAIADELEREGRAIDTRFLKSHGTFSGDLPGQDIRHWARWLRTQSEESGP